MLVILQKNTLVPDSYLDLFVMVDIFKIRYVREKFTT